MIKFKAQKRLHGTSGDFLMDLSTEFAESQLTAIFGPSGSGKTTILRIIAGLEKPDQGKVVVDEEPWFDSANGIDLPAGQRRVGMVTQEFALFPNMSVEENIAFAVQDKEQKSKKSQEMLQLLDLKNIADKKPAQLSGGQQQRVALGRALAMEPNILLLDEPLSSLDAEMRERLQVEIKNIYQQYKITTVLVSHSIPEVFALADQVHIINDGKITRSGLPIDVFADGSNGKSQWSARIISIDENGSKKTIKALFGNAVIELFPSTEMDLKVNDRVKLNPENIQRDFTKEA